MVEKKDSNDSFLGGALFGALIGMVAGILLAPDKGENTRRKLKAVYADYSEKGRYLADEAVEAASELKLAAKPFVDEVEAKLAPIIERAKAEGPAVKGEIVEKIAQLTDMMERGFDDVRDGFKGKQKDLKRRFFRNS